MLEVCEAQIQFGAADDTEIPIFGGTKGPEITKSLLGIRSSFRKHIQDLSNLSYPILDAQSTKWLEDHGKFKNGIKDLELVVVNIMNTAFATVSTIENGVEMLEAFSYLAKRDTIKRNLDAKTSALFAKFLSVR